MINKSGYKIIKKVISEREIDMIERNYIKFIALYCADKDKQIAKIFKKILSKKGNDFRKLALSSLIKVEKKNKNLFYSISKDFGNSLIFRLPFETVTSSFITTVS